MNEKDLLKSVGNIDEKFINDADVKIEKRNTANKKRAWKIAGSLAACFVLVVAAGSVSIGSHMFKAGNSYEDAATMEMAPMAAEDMEEAYKMAVEAIGLCIDEKLKNKEKLPKVSSPVDYLVEDGDFSCLIEFDLMQYRRTHNSKSVKKTLTIPEWLNEIAISQNINFSQVLQDALIQKMGV